MAYTPGSEDLDHLIRSAESVQLSRIPGLMIEATDFADLSYSEAWIDDHARAEVVWHKTEIEQASMPPLVTISVVQRQDSQYTVGCNRMYRHQRI